METIGSLSLYMGSPLPRPDSKHGLQTHKPLYVNPKSSTLQDSTLTLRLKMAQKPYVTWSLGPKALKYESLEL